MKNLIFICTLFVGVNASNAQNLESILLASDDASLLLENYLNPVMKGLMNSMNGGWYSTAKTHKKFGFDITIGTSAAFTPDKDQMFQFVSDQYEFISVSGGNTSIPTILSKDETETEINVSVPFAGNTFKVGSFKMPGGIAKDLPANATPAPFVQVGFGLPFKTTIKLRYVPKTNFASDVEANLIGVGLQHDLTQYLGIVSKLPFSVSLLGAYTSASVEYAIKNDALTNNLSVSNGLAQFKLKTWTVQALASLDFKIVTIYGGLGYNGGTSNFDIKGKYSLTYDIQDSGQNDLSTLEETITDPVKLAFKTSGARATIGTRLNLAFFKIFADYTLQEYNTATLGVAFSFR
ncbi:hypothetical protein N9887_02335 [Flavobacteriaceae bacterium]|nr:hypothetical protein [Flavobacteriaceae bacterium]MDB4289898.1 hypothetical protein [Flavobacteriaceae bacterium]